MCRFRWNPNLPLKKLRVGIDQTAFDAVSKETKAARKRYADALDSSAQTGRHARSH